MALFAVLDVETTGLSPAQGDRVVEIAVVILDEQFRVVRMFDSLVDPQRSIPSQVTEIHGISNHAVRSAPTFAELVPGLMECLSETTHLVAHNISFDLGFLRSELSDCGAEMPQSFGRLCTMQIARRKRVAHNAKLSSVASALCIPTIANAHRAIVDAAITARVLSLLHQEDKSVTHNPICWQNLQLSNGGHRQFPRGNPPISIQSLVHFGLTVAAGTATYRADNTERSDLPAEQHTAQNQPAQLLQIMRSNAQDADGTSPNEEMNRIQIINRSLH